jgi:hypothetical protein
MRKAHALLVALIYKEFWLSENDNILTGLRSTAEGRPPDLWSGGFTTQQMRYHRLSRRG